MNSVFVTFVYGDDSYFKFGKKLLDKFKEYKYTTYVYTDNPDYFKDHNVIDYTPTKFSYHHKINAIELLYKKGYKEVLYMDADLLISDDIVFNILSKIKFEDGISFTRNGTPSNLESFINDYNLFYYKDELNKNGVNNFSEIESIWEDILFFKNVGEDFFSKYRELTELKHKSDESVHGWNRFGDQEGYTISISAKSTNTKIQINPQFENCLSFFRASNYTYGDTPLLSILNDLDIIIPFRRDSDERLSNLKTVLKYYKKHIPGSNIIVSEQGTEQNILVNGFDYIFRKKDLPHNQSQCINDGVKLSKKKYICVIDCDIILLNYHNIYFALKDMFMDELDYCLPYTDCFDLPEFNLREPWGGKCVGGIFIIDREKFIDVGMNDEKFIGWGREDDERHDRLLKNGLIFKRMSGHIIHMNHPMQSNLVETAENNMNILNQLRNDNSHFDKI